MNSATGSKNSIMQQVWGNPAYFSPVNFFKDEGALLDSFLFLTPLQTINHKPEGNPGDRPVESTISDNLLITYN